MRSTPSEEVFMPENLDIIDIEGNPVCRLKRQIPAKKEIPILKLLIQALEETGISELLLQITSSQETISNDGVLDSDSIRVLFTHLPKLLNIVPDHIVKCFSILIDLSEEEVLDRFTLAYMIEVLVPFLLYVFKTWIEQFQVIGQTVPKVPIPTMQTS